MSLIVEVAGRSDVGCVRKNNEDNYGFDSRHGIYVVCDGMGGQAAGEVASKLAVDTILAYFRDSAAAGSFDQVGPSLNSASDLGNALSSAIHMANTAVFEGSGTVGQAGMGSTIVAVAVSQQGLYSVGHVGDSRIYLVRDGKIQQLTQDHSLVMEQVRRGLITLEEAKTSEVANIIIRALGADRDVIPDIDDLVAKPGDVLLLCSDGLTRELEDPQLEEIINAHSSKPLKEVCDALIDQAKQNGGNDNVTALLLRFREQSWLGSVMHKLAGEQPQFRDSM